MRVTIKTRRDTEINWSTINPKLALGEMGIETDTKKIKFGDGNTLWNDLDYINAGTGGEVIAEDIDDRISDLLVAGSGISLDYNDGNDTLTIATSGISGTSFDAAVPWTSNHTLVDGTRYLANDLVYESGRLYKANFDNESIPVTDTTYWTDVGAGYRLNIDGRDIANIPNIFDQSLNTTNTPTFIGVNLSNGTTLAQGTFDNSTGGQSGISLNCYVGYELNWQGGHLKSTADNGLTSANIWCDSAIEFQGTGIDNVEINNSGIIFSDGTTLSSASFDSNDISDFNSAVSGLIIVKNIVAGDNINLDNTDGVFTISVSGISGGGSGVSIEEVQDDLGNSFLVAGTGISLNYLDASGILTISTSGVSLTGHTHTSTNITDFNTAVSGLLPVKAISAGTNISITNDSGLYTINHDGDASVIKTTVFNSTGSQIPKFKVVYINGGQGDLPTIGLASYNGEGTSSKTYAITAEAIDHMSTGQVVVMGALTGLNTDQFNPTAPTGNVNGTTLWLSSSGNVTTTKPSAPYHAVSVGTIVRTHQNEGVVEVKIQNGYEIGELHDVAVSGVTSGQFLQYNGSGLWVPSSSGNFTILQVGGTAVSVSGHTHTASNITDFNSSVSGLLPTIANSGDNRLLTSTGTSTGVNGESNMTFDGNLLTVTGSGNFTTGLNVNGTAVSVSGHTHTASNITDFNSSVSGLLPSGIVVSNTSGITGASSIINIVAISQANYDALSSYNANTIYYIV